jgi:hypothetical protein
MKKVLFLIAAVFLFIATSCNNEPRKPKSTDEILEMASKAPGINAGKQSYTLSIPKGWTEKDTVISNVKFHFIFPPAEESITGANINILNESMSGLSLDRYMKTSVSNMQSMMPGFKLLEQGDFTSTTGEKITWIHYLMKRGNIDLEGILYFLPHNDIAYLMTGIALKDKMDQYRGIFDRVAGSIKFKDKE